MQTLAKRLLDRERTKRFGILDAYRPGCPPMVTATESQRRTYTRSTGCRGRTTRAPSCARRAERMLVRAIRTAVDHDDEGDAVAWRYWTANGLDTASTDVHSDMLTFSEGYVRVGQRPDGTPIALRRDPRFCIAVEDPLNPLETIAAFELLWDEFTGYDYAYLWLPGEQWVAERPRRSARVRCASLGCRRQTVAGPAWRGGRGCRSTRTSFTMRPNVDEVDES
jgi:hypothetical protein